MSVALPEAVAIAVPGLRERVVPVAVLEPVPVGLAVPDGEAEAEREDGVAEGLAGEPVAEAVGVSARVELGLRLREEGEGEAVGLGEGEGDREGVAVRLGGEQVQEGLWDGVGRGVAVAVTVQESVRVRAWEPVAVQERVEVGVWDAVDAAEQEGETEGLRLRLGLGLCVWAEVSEVVQLRERLWEADAVVVSEWVGVRVWERLGVGRVGEGVGLWEGLGEAVEVRVGEGAEGVCVAEEEPVREWVVVRLRDSEGLCDGVAQGVRDGVGDVGADGVEVGEAVHVSDGRGLRVGVPLAV